MRGCGSCSVLGVSLIVLGLLVGLGWGNETSSPANPSAGSSAPQLVESALAAEYSPGRGDRNALLQTAIQQDPDYAPARWHAGYVRQGDAWVPVAEAERRAAADPRLAEYRRLRDKQAGTPQGELALARWCRTNRLESEARFHWLNVLQAQPQNPEALKNLGLHWENGRLVSREQAKEIKEAKAKLAEARMVSNKDWPKHWTPLVAKWRRSIDRGETDFGHSMKEEIEPLTKLKPLESARAAEALGTIVLRSSRAKGEQKQARVLGEKLVETIDATQAPWVTPFLAWYSVDHPMEEVRTAAADALGRRPMETYVPLLLARMRPRVDTSFKVITYPDGQVAFQHVLDVQGAETNFFGTHTVLSRPVYGFEGLFESATERIVDPATLDGNTKAAVAADLQQKANLKAPFVARSRAEAAARAADTQRRIDQYNTLAAQVNQRAQASLTRATGEELAADPNKWYKWWRDRWYEEYELTKPPEEKPEYEFNFNRYPPSCFPCGTKVWTATGPMQIEKIKVGDQVLSQDPRSGELAYKPVLLVTTREPSPLIKVGLGKYSITSTRGHPFWVSGTGWKMAKDLKVGMPLHTLSGPVTIESVEELPPAKPSGDSPDTASYNLIVDQFHTYFVGDQRLLVHDNQLYPFDGVLGPMPGMDAP